MISNRNRYKQYSMLKNINLMDTEPDIMPELKFVNKISFLNYNGNTNTSINNTNDENQTKNIEFKSSFTNNNYNSLDKLSAIKNDLAQISRPSIFEYKDASNKVKLLNLLKIGNNNNNTNNNQIKKVNNDVSHHTSVTNTDREDSLERYSLNKVQLDYEKNIPSIIKALCDQGYSLIIKHRFNDASELFKKAEKIFEKYNSMETKLEYDVLHLLFNNLAVSNYKQGNLENACSYIQAILSNLNLSKSQRESKINTSVLGGTNIDPLNCFGLMNQKLKIKTYKCRANMHGCIIFSELRKHEKALLRAKMATRYACELILDSLLTVYYLLQKSTDQSQNGLSILRQNSYMKRSPTPDLFKKNEMDLSTDITSNDTNTSNQDTRGAKAINKTGYAGNDPKIQYYLRIIPILEELLKRIFENNKLLQNTKREILLKDLRQSTSNLPFEELDLNNVYSHTKFGHWITEINLLSVLQLKGLNSDHTKFNDDLHDEIKNDSIIERIIMLVACLYSISTEIRFLNDFENDIDQKTPREEYISESENWISKSVEIAYLFLPHDVPMVGQIFSVYTKLHSLSNQIIPEDEELEEIVKYLKSFRGGSKSTFFIPLIRRGKAFDELDKILNYEIPSQEEPIQTDANSRRILNLLKKNYSKYEAMTKIKSDFSLILKKIHNKLPPSNRNGSREQHRSGNNSHEREGIINSNDSPSRQRNKVIKPMKQSPNSNSTEKDSQQRQSERKIKIPKCLNEEDAKMQTQFTVNEFNERKLKIFNPQAQAIIKLSNSGIQKTMQINNTEQQIQKTDMISFPADSNTFNQVMGSSSSSSSSAQTKPSIGIQGSSYEKKMNIKQNIVESYDDQNSNNLPIIVETNNKNDQNEQSIEKLIPRPPSENLKDSSEKKFRNLNKFLNVKPSKPIINQKEKVFVRKLFSGQERSATSISPDIHSISFCVQEKNGNILNASDNELLHQVKKDKILSGLSTSMDRKQENETSASKIPQNKLIIKNPQRSESAEQNRAKISQNKLLINLIFKDQGGIARLPPRASNDSFTNGENSKRPLKKPKMFNQN